MVFTYLSVVFAAAFVLYGSAEAEFSASVSMSDEGITGFHISVGEYYDVPYKEVVIVKESRIPDEEVPVVLLIASRAGVPKTKVIELRSGGMSWHDITLRLGLSPEIFYVPVNTSQGPPYGKAYGYYKNKPRAAWKSAVLTDRDIIDLVNLKFISEHYGIDPDDVVDMKASGKDFISINGKVKSGKGSRGSNGKNKRGGKGKGRK